MGLEDRKETLRKEIERKARYLEMLEAMPDFEALADGSIVAMTVTYGASNPYPVVAYKRDDKWSVTGSRSPDSVSSDDLSEWLMSQGRHLRSATVIAEFTLEKVAPFDLGDAILTAMREQSERIRSVAPQQSPVVNLVGADGVYGYPDGV
jgi:hypothetical protein